jgi:glycine dehydrogenase
MLMSALKPLAELENPSEFVARHVGIDAEAEATMLKAMARLAPGAGRRDRAGVVPRAARAPPAGCSAARALASARHRANRVLKGFIGQGYTARTPWPSCAT